MTFQRGTQWGLDSEPAIDWTYRAACRSPDVDAELFFPQQAASVDLALQVCRRCPVTAECLEKALEFGDPWGVWGGMTPEQRAAVALCRRGRCRHPEHRGEDYARMVARVAELAGQGMQDRVIAKRVGWSADQVYRVRRAHGIKAGWQQRGSAK